ncbi:hypothetical protein NHX12_019473 [Muraenolepis orangiensis]|uniref:G-protein coupled receptors family 1 profile domain-containing protein n=1 Tax=Muraenolepis orangiensis TaxID=630683 RepID=A0A9Q0IW98_9TELE|nr:hypothetical protein NHX12_019018 [Muraenolepis orangiensis]KAJ3613223.1 hypothetical protein NHX12_019473 [Muraenolepis orangiensis]
MEPIHFSMITTTTKAWSDNSTALPNASLDRNIVPPYMFIVCALGLLGNSFVLLVFLAQKDRLTVPEIYLGNLALADFVLLVVLPFWAMEIRKNSVWRYGEAMCKIVNSSVTVNVYTSIYIIAMVSVDRYLALVQTMRARWLRRTLYAKVICVVMWLWGVFMSTPILVYRRVNHNGTGALKCKMDYGPTWRLAHQIAFSVLGFALPVVVIVFCSGAVIRALNRRRTVCSDQGSERKPTTLVFAVTTLFLVCWAPYHVFNFLTILREHHLVDETQWGHALNIGDQVAVCMALLNSVLNPVLYVFFGQYFWKKVSFLFRKPKHHHRRGCDRSV